MLTCSFPSPRGVVCDTQEVVGRNLEKLRQYNQTLETGSRLSILHISGLCRAHIQEFRNISKNQVFSFSQAPDPLTKYF